MESAEFKALAEKIQRLSDIEEIQQLKSAYFRCIDTANIEELREILTEDYSCRCVGGNYEYVASGREEFLRMTEDSFNSKMVTQHNAHGPEIKILGPDRATGVWYFSDQIYNFFTKQLIMGTGLYRDGYVKLDGRWRIQSASYERIYQINETLTREPNFVAHYLGEHGKRLPDSAVYVAETGAWIY